MSDPQTPFTTNPEPYIPATLGEIQDYLYGIIGYAPTFIDDSGWFPDRTIDTDFHALTAGFEPVRKKVGEERYRKLWTLLPAPRHCFWRTPRTKTARRTRAWR